MKKFLLLSTIALSALSMMAQTVQDITIGGDDGANIVSKDNTLTPISPYYKTSQAQMVWTAEQLTAAGITPGTVIKGAKFYGSNIETSKDMTYSLSVYMDVTTLSELVPSGSSEAPVAMYEDDLVYSEAQCALPSVGSTADPEVLIAFTLSTPFTYTGDNLVMQMNRVGGNWSSNVYLYGYQTLGNQTVARQTDGDGVANMAWSNAKMLPKVTFTCETALDGVKAVAADSPAVRVMNNAISVDTQSTISVVAVNGMSVASVNGTSLDTSSLPAGIYIVTVRNENGVSTQRFVKK